MASEAHVKFVLAGKAALERWHAEHPKGILDLRRADFHKRSLNGLSPCRASLEWADFRWCDLIETDFGGANLGHADFHKADLRGADFSGCDLTEANLEDAICDGASFHGATFKHTRMYATNLTGAKGLDQVTHADRSVLDDETLSKSRDLPDSFVLGCRRGPLCDLADGASRIGSARGVSEEWSSGEADEDQKLRVDWCERDYKDNEDPEIHSTSMSAVDADAFVRKWQALRLRIDERHSSIRVGKGSENLWGDLQRRHRRMLWLVLSEMEEGLLPHDRIYEFVFEDSEAFDLKPHRSRCKGELCRKLGCGLERILRARPKENRYERCGGISYYWIRREKGQSKLLDSPEKTQGTPS